MKNQLRPAVPSDDEASLILELFADRQERYIAADVQRLTRISKRELATAAKAAQVRNGVFDWEEVAQLAAARWSPRMLHAVLGGFLPPLNRTAVIPAELPIYQIRMLHGIAMAGVKRGTPRLNASDVLEMAIHHYAEDEYFTTVDAVPPAITAAMGFPLFQTGPHLVRPCCAYCGITTAKGDPCAACLALHEPYPNGTEQTR